VVVQTDETSGCKVTIEQLDAALSSRTKVLLFVSPDNPSGSVYTPAEVAAIGQWAVERGVWVVTDEIYEHLTYGPHEFSSMPTLVPDIADQCIVVNGVAKTYAMTGWRVGWMIGPDDVMKAANNFQSHATSNVANVAQRAALAAVAGGLDDVAMMRAAFERRGRTMYELLNAIPGVTAIEPQGAFYGFPSLEGVLGRTIRGRTSHTTAELSEVLLDEAKVAIVPGEAFGAPGYARLSFAVSDDDIVEGITRIAKLLTE
jgi:aspartate/methionine/tyrosine aminotransferase